MTEDVGSRADLRAVGVTAGQVDHEVAYGRWLRLRDGMYCSRTAFEGAPDARSRHRFLVAAAQGRVANDAVASMWSAALLHGLPVPYADLQQVSLTRPFGAPRGYRDLRVRDAQLPAHHMALCEGIPVTSVARTLVDLARRQPMVDVVSAGDAALHLGLTSLGELIEVLDDCRGWPGIKRARKTVEFADGGAESVLESRSRVRLVLGHGVPSPLLNQWVSDSAGRPFARVDMLWERYNTVGEADGKLKYGADNPDALFLEKQREDTLRELGYQVVRWTYREIERTPGRVAARLRRAFARGSR